MNENEVPDIASFPHGTVMRCTRQLGDKVYTYICLKTPVGWYLTGMKTYRTTAEMERWLRHATFSREHEIATGWTDVDEFTVGVVAHD